MVGRAHRWDAVVVEHVDVWRYLPQHTIGPRRHPLLRGRVVRVRVTIELVCGHERYRSFLKTVEYVLLPHLNLKLLVRMHHFHHLCFQKRADHLASTVDAIVEVAEPEHDIERVPYSHVALLAQIKAVVDRVVVGITSRNGIVVRCQVEQGQFSDSPTRAYSTQCCRTVEMAIHESKRRFA